MLLKRVLNPGQATLQDRDNHAAINLSLVMTFPFDNDASLMSFLRCEFSWCHFCEKSGIMLSALLLR